MEYGTKPENLVEKEVDQYTPTAPRKRTHESTTTSLPSRKEQTLGNTTRFDTTLYSLWAALSDFYDDMGMPAMGHMMEEQLYWYMNAKRSEGGFTIKELGKNKTELSGKMNYEGKAPTVVNMPNGQ
jgi:hypothetical protein